MSQTKAQLVGNVVGISTFNSVVNVGITSIKSGIITASSGIVTYFGDGSFLSGIDATRIINGTSNVTVGIGTTISATVAGENIFNVTDAGVTMVAGKRFDVSSYSETVQTLGSSGSPISGTNALNIGTYSTFVAYVGASTVTFTLSGAVAGRLSSWTLILIYTASVANRDTQILFSFGTIRYAGGRSSVILSNTTVHDVLSFFTADGATNTYASVVGLGFAT